MIRSLRTWTNTPIIVLTARGDQTQKVKALDAGADDYLTKPFEIDELFARIRAVSRRVGPAAAELARIGRWYVDVRAHRVSDAMSLEADQHLTPTEWKILEALLRNPGRLVTRSQLLLQVWGSDHDPETSSLRLYIAQLRRKLEPDPTRPRYLLTESGMGYRYFPAGDTGTP